jgi:methylmalonyl-CoA mutase N-terminal domain/subunit
MTQLKTVEAPPKAASSQPVQETSSHIAVRPLYTPEDLAAWDYDRDVGYPGQFPYTRGVQATMYRGRLWTMRQYAGMGDAEESNKRYKYLLANGTTGLSVAFDLPTQIGLDSDHPLAAGEVGKVGVAIDSIEDMQRLFDGIDLTKISTSMTINATASILLALICGRGAAAGHGHSQTFRHCAERCAQGVHRARDLYLSAATGDAHHHRHFCLDE